MGPGIRDKYEPIDYLKAKPAFLEVTKPAISPLKIDFSKQVSAPVAAPEKKGFFGAIGSIFNSKMGNDLNDAGRNMKSLDAETAKPFDFKNSYESAGLSISGNQPAGNTANNATTNPVANVAGTNPPAVNAPAVNPPVGNPAGTTPIVTTGDAEKDIKKVENEPGSLGEIKDKKQKITDAYAKKLMEDPKVKADYDAQKTKIDDKYNTKKSEIEKEYANNPAKMAEKLAKLDAKKTDKMAGLDGKINNKAEKIAGKVDKNYQELSKSEAEEQKTVNQFKENFDLKDSKGKKLKLSDEEISNMAKKSDCVSEEEDEDGNKIKVIDREKLKEATGITAKYKPEVIQNNPEKVLNDPNATPAEIKKAEQSQFLQLLTGGASQQKPAQVNWMEMTSQAMQGFTAFNEQRKFGAYTHK